MLTNTVIKVTFGDLRAQQISAIIFQCGVLYRTEFDFLRLFIYLSPRKNGFKYPALLINIFIFKRKPNLDLLCWTRYVSICSMHRGFCIMNTCTYIEKAPRCKLAIECLEILEKRRQRNTK